jgi:hypothetical protein
MDNMDLIKRMRVGDEIPTINEGNRTVDRGGGGAAAKRATRNGEVVNVASRQLATGVRQLSLRRIPKDKEKDKEASNSNDVSDDFSSSLQGKSQPVPFHSHGQIQVNHNSNPTADSLVTLRRDIGSNPPFSKESLSAYSRPMSVMDTGEFSTSTGRDSSETMQLIGTGQRDNDSNRHSNDLKAALKYFRRAPSERSQVIDRPLKENSFIANIDNNFITDNNKEGKIPENTTEALGQQVF